MQRIVWKFGLISGAIVAVSLYVATVMVDSTKPDNAVGMVVGYTSMVLAFMLVYFGIRKYRDEVLGGRIPFSKAFFVGFLIMLISCVCYVGTWEVIYFKVMPDFGDKFAAAAVERAKAKGASAAEIEKTRVEMEEFSASYRNPMYNAAVTFLEPFPVGLVITLVSAGILSRRRAAP